MSKQPSGRDPGALWQAADLCDLCQVGQAPERCRRYLGNLEENLWESTIYIILETLFGMVLWGFYIAIYYATFLSCLSLASSWPFEAANCGDIYGKLSDTNGYIT